MEFESTRFLGHPRLYQILNDSDPGTLKLQRGDQGDDVRAVQQALFDLGWTSVLSTPITETDFVIGIFGPRTEESVLLYKTHYDILPAGADPATTPYTGTVGPRTLTKLDHQCALYDASRANIVAKAEILIAGGEPVVLSPNRPSPNSIGGTSGVYWDLTYGAETGSFYDEASVGTFEVHGPLFEEFVQRGWVYELGFPCSDVILMDDGTLRTDFQAGSLVYDPVLGSYTFFPATA